MREAETQVIGLGGVGDCFIIILKLLERRDKNFQYTHLCSSEEKGKMCTELLGLFDIKHRSVVVKNPRAFWEAYSNTFHERLNVFASGYIDVPRQPFHWQPCTDSGVSNPYPPEVSTKENKIVVQVNATPEAPLEKLETVNCPEGRHYSVRPIEAFVKKEFEENLDNVVWIGTDKNFECDFGTNKVGKQSIEEVFKEISTAEYFVGFNSVLLYWALYNKLDCALFPDHQGRFDTRIHKEWKNHLNYIDQ